MGKTPAYKHPVNYFVRVFDKSRRSVVSIHALHEADEEETYFPFVFPSETEGLGSGFLINRQGVLLTNEHVVHNASQVTVKLYNGKQCVGKVIWTDPIVDIALIQISPPKSISPLSLGSSRTCKVGESVMAVGNPLGLEQSISTGVISGKDRSFLAINSNRKYEDIIQTDCVINPGSSGGPLININGQVIGVNAFVVKNSQGLGFAIGIDNIKKRIGRYLTDGLRRKQNNAP